MATEGNIRNWAPFREPYCTARPRCLLLFIYMYSWEVKVVKELGPVVQAIYLDYRYPCIICFENDFDIFSLVRV